MFKVSYRNTRTRCEVRLKLTLKTPERHQLCRSVVFINYEHISRLFLVDYCEISREKYVHLFSCFILQRKSILTDTHFFYKQHFYKQRHAEIGKKSSKY